MNADSPIIGSRGLRSSFGSFSAPVARLLVSVFWIEFCPMNVSGRIPKVIEPG